METHNITVGDTLTPLGAQLKQKNAAGVLEAAVLTGGQVVKFKMVHESGTTKVSETSDNVTVTDAANGKVQYDFQSDDVNVAGIYYAWFRVYDSGETERDTFPVDGRTFKIIIKDTA